MNRELHIGRGYKHFKGKTYLPQRVVRNAAIMDTLDWVTSVMETEMRKVK